jgi:hypothetical protein
MHDGTSFRVKGEVELVYEPLTDHRARSRLLLSSSSRNILQVTGHAIAAVGVCAEQGWSIAITSFVLH